MLAEARRGAGPGPPRVAVPGAAAGHRGAAQERAAAGPRGHSSLELGLDLGAVELVVQVASPAVSRGIQRIGRASTRSASRPCAWIFPKHRGDLLACVRGRTRRMKRVPEIETNPLPEKHPRRARPAGRGHRRQGAIGISVDALVSAFVRRAAPVCGAAASNNSQRAARHAVWALPLGRVPRASAAHHLVPPRRRQALEPRKGAKQIAIANAGVIPDRGLYGVFLAGENDKKSRRVGELDEEMVHESRAGETFLLGASTWRIEDITFDRVVVTPAPGQPGKMPFWHGDGPGRPVRARRGHGRLRPRAPRHGPRRRPGPAGRRARPGRLGRRQPPRLPRRAARGRRGGPRRPHHRRRALPRRARRLARVPVEPLLEQVHAPWAMALEAGSSWPASTPR